MRWCPQPKPYPAVGLNLGAEGHAVHAAGRARGPFGIQQSEHAAQRDRDPIRTVGQLISQLVKRLLQHEEPHHFFRHRTGGRTDAAAFSGIEIAVEIGARGLGLPCGQAPSRELILAG
jgi:hypothetical protein